MSILIPDIFIKIDRFWPQFKAIAGGKNLPIQFEDMGTFYRVFAIDAPIAYLCDVYKTGNDPNGNPYALPDFGDAYSAQQAATDQTEFESLKASYNAALQPRTKDGRVQIKTSTANRTTNFNLRVISFYTAKKDSLHNVNPVTDHDYGDATLIFQKWDPTANTNAGGWIAAADDGNDATRTLVDWEPHYNYEIIGGYVDVHPSLLDGTTDAWFLSVIGVPDLPANYGGQVSYISEVNLEAVTTQKVLSDGRAVSYLPYNYGGIPHTNKLRFVFKHPIGGQKRFQLYIEHFV